MASWMFAVCFFNFALVFSRGETRIRNVRAGRIKRLESGSYEEVEKRWGAFKRSSGAASAFCRQSSDTWLKLSGTCLFTIGSI